MGPSAPQLYSFYDEDIPNLINTHVGTENYLLSPLPVQQNFRLRFSHLMSLGRTRLLRSDLFPSIHGVSIVCS